MEEYLSSGPVDEEWRLLPVYDNYAVSNYGRVYNTVSQTPLNGWVASNGTIRVRLIQDGKVDDYYVHTLVAYLYFEESYQEGVQVRHIDGNKKNNYAGNLEVIGPHRGRGPHYQPEYGGGRLVRIIETGEIFANVTAVAQALQTDYSTIYKCLRGERKKHLGYSFEYV